MEATISEGGEAVAETWGHTNGFRRLLKGARCRCDHAILAEICRTLHAIHVTGWFTHGIKQRSLLTLTDQSGTCTDLGIENGTITHIGYILLGLTTVKGHHVVMGELGTLHGKTGQSGYNSLAMTIVGCRFFASCIHPYLSRHSRQWFLKIWSILRWLSRDLVELVEFATGRRQRLTWLAGIC